MRQKRLRARPTLVAERLDLLLTEWGWGARERLLARIHLLAQRDNRFSALATLKANQISTLRKGNRGCSDLELIALAAACNVSVAWLCGVSDRRDPDPDLARLLSD